MEDLTTGNPTAVADGNPLTEPSATTNGTGEPNGEARQSATATDTFVPQGIDINTLPPSVRAHIEKINSDMVRGFTEKTTKLSETTKSEVAKATEAYRQKAELYDQIATQEEFVKMWNEHVQKSQAPQPGQSEPDPVTQKLKELEQKIQISEMTQVTESFAEAVDEKGQKIHPDFDELNGLIVGSVGGNEPFSLLRASIELAPGNSPAEKLANGYKTAKQVRDQIFEAGRKAGMGRLQTKLQNGTIPPSNGAGEVLSVTEKRPKSAREAMDLARKNYVVSRD